MTTILSISIPPALRSALVAEAKRQRRSRSFVVAEAVRDYVARRREDAFALARERTLREGLALAPAARLRLSEDLWNELARGRNSAPPFTATFATFEDHEAWRRGGGGVA